MLKRGDRFFHARVLEPGTLRPMEYVVTRVAQGMVWYRPTDGGKSECTEIENFHKIIC